MVLDPLAVLIDPDKIEVLGCRLPRVPMADLAAGSHGDASALAVRARLMKILGERAAPMEVRNTPRLLLPRLLDAATWALPALVLVRSTAPQAVVSGFRRLPWALEDMAAALGDPSLPQEAMQAFTESVLGDEFTGRVAGDTARSGHAARALPGVLPWVVACLPDEFSLTDLHRAVIACLSGGLATSATWAAESPSNFRRRVNDLVLSGVLEEMPSAGRPAEADRPGRPPRMFRFSKSAWSAWLLRRSGTPASMTPAPAMDTDVPQMTVALQSIRDVPMSQQFMSALMRSGSAAKPPGPGRAPEIPAADDSRLFIELRDLLKKYSQGQ